MLRMCERLCSRAATRGIAPLMNPSKFHRVSVRARSDRSYPTEPRIGVGVVVFKPATAPQDQPQVLLIKRGKEPNKGLWCFPGGSQELGETIADCAVREVMEETGVSLRYDKSAPEAFSSALSKPTAFAAVDSIWKDPAGKLKFHYAIIEVAALVAGNSAEPQASDDADAVMWIGARDMMTLAELTPMCAEITQEAVERFAAVLVPSRSASDRHAVGVAEVSK